MKKNKMILYVSTILCLVMPIISIEGIIPWIVSLLIMHKNFKVYRESNNIRSIIINLLICMLTIVLYNIAGRIIQDILVKLWV